MSGNVGNPPPPRAAANPASGSSSAAGAPGQPSGIDKSVRDVIAKAGADGVFSADEITAIQSAVHQASLMGDTDPAAVKAFMERQYPGQQAAIDQIFPEGETQRSVF